MFVTRTLSLAAGLSVLAGAVAAAELKVAHFMAPQHVMHREVMAPLAEAIAKETGGKLTMKIYPGGELGKGPNQQYMRAVDGIADITFGLQGYTSSQFPRTMMMHLPGIGMSAAETTEMLWRAIDDVRPEYKGTHILGVWTNEAAALFTKDKPVTKVEDFKGLKIRVPSKEAGEALAALGATPVSMPANEIYNAMQTGTVDAVLIGPSAVKGFKLNEVAKHMTNGLPISISPFFLVMNKGAYDALPADQKAALDKVTGRDFSMAAAKAYDEDGAKGLKVMQESGQVHQMAPGEMEKLQAEMAKVREKMLADAEKEGIPARQIYAKMTGK